MARSIYFTLFLAVLLNVASVLSLKPYGFHNSHFDATVNTIAHRRATPPSPKASFTSRLSTSTAISSYLAAHNSIRAKHGAQPLTWSVSLALKAAIWADTCSFRPSNGALSTEPYGENLVAATGLFPISAAVATFASDKKAYRANKPVYNHWTQVVWKSTTEVGCASAVCDSAGLENATFHVCFYNPPGNVVGQAP